MNGRDIVLFVFVVFVVPVVLVVLVMLVVPVVLVVLLVLDLLLSRRVVSVGSAVEAASARIASPWMFDMMKRITKIFDLVHAPNKMQDGDSS